MLIPYLKNKVPRVAPEPTAERLVNGSGSDHLDDHMTGELMEACANKNTQQFRNALEALVLNLFDWDGEENAK